MLNFLLTLLLAQTANYPAGTVVDITLTDVEPGWMFTGWVGDAAGPENPLRLTLTTNMAIEATFAQINGDVTLSVTAPHALVSVVVVPSELPPAQCGDGNLDAGEGCDDGNLLDGDGCSALCEIEPPPLLPVCGNSVLEMGETCDDGNMLGGDGCSSTCQTEAPLPPPLTGNPGWQELLNTKLRAVCPPDNFGGEIYEFSYYCQGVVTAWNGGVFDSARNRLIIWGGGHGDYKGNELYALNLGGVPTMVRLTDPAVPLAVRGTAPESLAGGAQPNSRHTYDGIAYMENADRMFVFGGALSQLGWNSSGTWTYSFTSRMWEPHSPVGTVPAGSVAPVTAYDPVTGDVFLHNDRYFYRYDFAADSYIRLSTTEQFIDYHLNAVIDPIARKFVAIGNNEIWVYDLATNARVALATTGAATLVQAVYPGLAFHPPSGKIVGWAGGDTVYSLDLASGVWTSYSYPLGPGPQQNTGTHGRWQFSPALNAFVVINSVDANAFLFRLP